MVPLEAVTTSRIVTQRHGSIETRSTARSARRRRDRSRSARASLGSTRSERALLIVLVPYMLTAVILPPAARAAEPGRMTSTELVGSLGSGEALVLERTRVTGDVDLTELHTVNNLFVCSDCTVVGDLRASNVVFRGPLDLSGLHVTGDVDLRGAIFAQAALFGSPRGNPTKVDGDADFSLVTFYELADFERVTFKRSADFPLAQFRADGIFTEAVFQGQAVFQAAIFENEARFGGGASKRAFHRGTTFERASFRGNADFRQRKFMRSITFAGADFLGRADFGQTTFEREATFDRVVFAEGSSFTSTDFNGDRSDLSASFERATARGKIDFEDADFWTDAVFRNLGAPAVSFKDADFHGSTIPVMTGISTGDLLFPLDDVSRLNTEDRKPVLELVESSAKARGDLGLANDARFRLQVLASGGYWWGWRVLDFTLYRGVAGYFVRPRRPLLVLLALALAMTLYRELRRSNPGEHASTPTERTASTPAEGDGATPAEGAGATSAESHVRADRLIRRPLSGFWSFVGELLDTLAPIIPGKSDAAAASTGRRLEVLVYRVLVVCALLGFANSNPTLRQMFDALL